jgi:CheY-like chemotaxis protein
MDSGLPPGIIASSGERSWNFLSLEGHAVQCAANGYEAFRLIVRAQTRPALIFLDLLMPVLDGCEFLVEQGKNPFLAEAIEYLRLADED